MENKNPKLFTIIFLIVFVLVGIKILFGSNLDLGVFNIVPIAFIVVPLWNIYKLYKNKKEKENNEYEDIWID